VDPRVPGGARQPGPPRCLLPSSRPSQTKERYFHLIERSIDSVKAKGLTVGNEAAEALSSAIASARERAASEGSAALDKVAALYGAFIAIPAVAKVLAESTPLVHAAFAKAKAAGSYVLDTPQYKTYVQPRVSYVASQPRVASAIERIRPLVPAF